MLYKLKNKYTYSYVVTRQLVITDFKIRYQGSVLGYFWTLLRPLALFIILYIVFVQFLKFGDSIPHFPIYLLVGIVLWNFFNEMTMGGLGSIVARGDLLRKLSFPRYTIVAATSISALINLGLNLLVVLFFILINNIPLGTSVLLVPLLILELYILSLGLTFLLSTLYVKFRDVNYIWEVILQGLFYLTPIIYPLSLVVDQSEKLAKLISLSPLAQIIQDVRFILVTDKTQNIYSLFGNLWWYAIPLGFVITLFIVSALYFKKASPNFAEEI
jgi:ABC-2 type transport system permease protein